MVFLQAGELLKEKHNSFLWLSESDSGQALGVAWSLMAEFSKASFLLSSACHLQERGGGHCSLLSGCTQKALSQSGRKRRCLLGQEPHLMPEWSSPPEEVSSPSRKTFGCSHSSKQLIASSAMLLWLHKTEAQSLVKVRADLTPHFFEQCEDGL